MREDDVNAEGLWPRYDNGQTLAGVWPPLHRQAGLRRGDASQSKNSLTTRPIDIPIAVMNYGPVREHLRRRLLDMLDVARSQPFSCWAVRIDQRALES